MRQTIILLFIVVNIVIVAVKTVDGKSIRRPWIPATPEILASSQDNTPTAATEEKCENDSESNSRDSSENDVIDFDESKLPMEY